MDMDAIQFPPRGKNSKPNAEFVADLKAGYGMELVTGRNRRQTVTAMSISVTL